MNRNDRLYSEWEHRDEWLQRCVLALLVGLFVLIGAVQAYKRGIAVGRREVRIEVYNEGYDAGMSTMREIANGGPQ